MSLLETNGISGVEIILWFMALKQRMHLKLIHLKTS